MEAKTEQTKENESPKVTDATLELGSALGSSHQKSWETVKGELEKMFKLFADSLAKSFEK